MTRSPTATKTQSSDAQSSDSLSAKARRISRRHAIALIGGAVAAPAVIRDLKAAEVTLRLHHMLPPVSTAHKTMFQPWAEKVMKESGGRIDVQIFPAMSLGGKPPELLDQLKGGGADFVWALPHYQPGRYPVLETWTLPFLITNSTQTSQSIHEYMNTVGAKEFAFCKPIAWWAQSPGLFMTKGKKIEKMEDLKGLRIRGGNQIITEAISMMGANGVFFPVTEVAQNLSKGVADGVALPYEIVPAFKLHELANCFAEVAKGGRNFYTVPMVFAMNLQKYEKLPDDLRKVIDANSGAAMARKFGADFDAGDAFGRSLCEKAGATFTTISVAEAKRWRDTVAPLTAQWIDTLNKKGFDGKMLVETADRLVDKYAKTA